MLPAATVLIEEDEEVVHVCRGRERTKKLKN